MIVYCIAKWRYLEDLSGTGARLHGGRWNKKNYPLIYASTTLSLSVLEILANIQTRLFSESFGYISIDIPDKHILGFDMSNLDSNWRMIPYSNQTVDTGTQWIEGKSSLGLKVPSSVLSQENNILINPLHPDFDQIKITYSGAVDLDGRLA